MPEVQIEDAYEAHVRARREREDTEKIATLVMPASDMAAVWKLIAEAVDSEPNLPAATKKRWESILRSLGRSIQEAE